MSDYGYQNPPWKMDEVERRLWEARMRQEAEQEVPSTQKKQGVGDQVGGMVGKYAQKEAQKYVKSEAKKWWNKTGTEAASNAAATGIGNYALAQQAWAPTYAAAQGAVASGLAPALATNSLGSGVGAMTGIGQAEAALAASQAPSAYAGTAATTGGGAGSTMMAAAPYLALAAAAYANYSNYSAAKKAAGGGNFTSEEADSTIHGIGGPLARKYGLGKVHDAFAQLSPMTHVAKALFGSTKNDGQILRDRVRKRMQDGKMLDSTWNMTLADGTSKFDMGKDGGARLTNDAGKTRRYYEADMEGANTGQTIGYVNPLAEIMTGGDDKLRNQFAGSFTNAASSNTKDLTGARANARDMYTKAGLDGNQAHTAIDELVKAGTVTADEATAYHGGINQTFSDTALEQVARQLSSQGSPGRRPQKKGTRK